MFISPINNVDILPKTNTSKLSPKKDENILQEEKLKSVRAENILSYNLSFKSTNTADEKIREIEKHLNSETLKQFNKLRESKLLFNNNSNDGSSVLDNLYKITQNERMVGLSKDNVLNETIKILSNPYSISQKFGKLPEELIPEIEKNINWEITQEYKQPVSATCYAASIEFNIADKQPAEFSRMVEGLTSANYCVKKSIPYTSISPSMEDSIRELNLFKTQYNVEKDDKTITLTLKPDRNAIIRARVQNSYKQPGERTCIDVLMQSMIMNLGSQNTYDTITDLRTGELNPDISGLTNYEGNFASRILEGINKYSFINQIISEYGKLEGHILDKETLKSKIDKALNSGYNVIAGYTELMNDWITYGHEITITGKTEKDGVEYYTYYDSNYILDKPMTAPADSLPNNDTPGMVSVGNLMNSRTFIEKIHHIDLPLELLLDDKNFRTEFLNKSLKSTKDYYLTGPEGKENSQPQ